MKPPTQARPIDRKARTAKIGGNVMGVNPQEDGSPTWPGNTSTWNCYLPGNTWPVAAVTIDWGHTKADAVWACNAWRTSECNNQCNHVIRHSVGLPPTPPPKRRDW